MGHITWIMMVKRPALSLLDSTYAFVQAASNKDTQLWDGVRRELGLVRALLPLLRGSTAAS